MAITIAIVNEKGGVGKTMTSFAIGSLLGHYGYKVLMVDTDKQADLTSACGIAKGPDTKNLFDVLSTGEVYYQPVTKNLSIIPGTRQIVEFYHNNDPYLLANTLEGIQDQFDIILIDCPPDIDSFSVMNGLCMADKVIVPTNPQAHGVSAVESILSLMNEIKDEGLNANLDLLGIVLTIFKTNTVLHEDTKRYLHDTFGDLVFNRVIREGIDAQISTQVGVMLEEFEDWKLSQSKVKIKKQSNIVTDYRILTTEIIERLNN